MCSSRNVGGFIVLSAFLATACYPNSGGPKPRDVFVISASSVEQLQILSALDSMESLLDERINRIDERWFHDGSPMFPHFEVAFWYPFESSRTYGVAVIKWKSGYRANSNNYYVSVYEQESPGFDCYWCKALLWFLRPFRLDQLIQDKLPLKECQLCGSVESKLRDSNIGILASCSNRDDSEFLRDRCGT